MKKNTSFATYFTSSVFEQDLALDREIETIDLLTPCIDGHILLSLTIGALLIIRKYR